MAKHTVITMPGDGIGNQVLPESLRILKAVGFDAEYIHADIGWDRVTNQASVGFVWRDYFEAEQGGAGGA
jgi:isocitrate/isopropylmalate dehydrogenase